MPAQTPALAQKELKKPVPLALREWIGTWHNSPGPLNISERKAGLYAGLSCITQHRAHGTVDNVSYGLDSQMTVDLKPRPEFFEMPER
ncbi:MAG: hypothetical protein WAN81_23340 [Candidatus Binataceae bacterium]